MQITFEISQIENNIPILTKLNRPANVLLISSSSVADKAPPRGFSAELTTLCSSQVESSQLSREFVKSVDKDKDIHKVALLCSPEI